MSWNTKPLSMRDRRSCRKKARLVFRLLISGGSYRKKEKKEEIHVQ
jgi:hypothetical protein